jgi:hypothetical protein
VTLQEIVQEKGKVLMHGTKIGDTLGEVNESIQNGI